MRNDIGARILGMALYQSGLMVVKVSEIHMMYNKYNPTRAGKYINLPKWIASKKASMNIKKKDEKCFKYAIHHNVSVNVFEVDDEQEQIVIGRKLKNKNAKCHVDLSRIDEDDISHYVYVKDCSRLSKIAKEQISQ